MPAKIRSAGTLSQNLQKAVIAHQTPCLYKRIRGGVWDGNEKRGKGKEPQVATRKREIKGKGGGWGRN